MKQKQRMVVVVEDDRGSRMLVAKCLALMGIEDIVEATDARSALEHFRRRRPDLVCLDLVLPESSGYELCEYIRKTPALADVPILVTSCRTLPADRAHAEALGANAYLVKPFTPEELTREVGRLLEEAPPLRALGA